MKRISIYNTKNNQNKRYKVTKCFRDNGFVLIPNGELLIVLGGDGTFLSAINEKHKEDFVFVGLNSGTLGFFSEFDYEELPQLLKVIKEGKYRIEEYPMYEVEIHQKNGSIMREFFINEVVVEKSSSKVIHMNVKINNEEVVYENNGIIFSTSLGSSGYAMAAGGALHVGKFNFLQISPIAQIRNKTYRGPINSLLVSDDSEIEIKPDKKKKRRFEIVCDGREIKTKSIEMLKIKKLSNTLKILRTENYDHLNQLKKKIF